MAHRVTRHAAHHQPRDRVLAGLGHNDEVCADVFRVFGDDRPNRGAAVAVDGQDQSLGLVPCLMQWFQEVLTQERTLFVLLVQQQVICARSISLCTFSTSWNSANTSTEAWTSGWSLVYFAVD